MLKLRNALQIPLTLLTCFFSKGENTTPNELLKYFGFPQILTSARIIMKEWIHKPGYPVIHVKVIDNKDIEVSQVSIFLCTSKYLKKI